MLKRNYTFKIPGISLITVQDNTMLKLSIGTFMEMYCLITVQDNTMLKPAFINNGH